MHVHSSYSVLDGLANPKDLVKYAKELGMTSLALTDHGTMFGTLDFFKAARAEGIKPIIGLEAYVAPRSMLDKDVSKDKKPYHLLLLAKNITGYKTCSKLHPSHSWRAFITIHASIKPFWLSIPKA